MRPTPLGGSRGPTDNVLDSQNGRPLRDRSPTRLRSRAHRVLASVALMLATLGGLCIGRTLSAQSSPDTLHSRGPWRLGVFVGGARNSPVSSTLGVTPGRDHLFLGISATTVVLRAGILEVSYCAQFLPAVLIWGNAAPSGFPLPGNTVPGSNPAYAIGLSPFGLQLAVPIGSHVEIFGATAAGALVFDREYPLPGAGRINFTLEFGGGVFVRLPHQRFLQFGYKYHHLSNANTAALNPGVDANVLYAGYQWSVLAPR